MAQSIVLRASAWLLRRSGDDEKIYIECAAFTANGISVNLTIPAQNYKIIPADDINLLNAYLQNSIVTNVITYNDVKLVLFTPDEFDNNYNESTLLTYFFVATGIKPYSYIIVSDYIVNKSIEESNTQVNISVANYSSVTGLSLEQVENQFSINVNRAFWDHEVYSARLSLSLTDDDNQITVSRPFPNAIRDSDEIFMTSVIIRDNIVKNEQGYLLTTLDGNYQNNERNEKIVLDNECTLINTMWKIFETDNIMRNYSYNGLNFDLPFTQIRMNKCSDKLNKRQKLSKLGRDEIPAQWLPLYYKGRFGNEATVIPTALGFETIDLLMFFVRFYPWLPNFKLETVGQTFLNEGKTGLPIEEVFQSFETKDYEKVGLAANYAMQDSVLLSRLENELKIDARLEELANNLRLTIEDMLTSSEEDIILHLLTMVLPDLKMTTASSTSVGIITNFDRKLMRASTKVFSNPGVYQNVYVYDYTQIYINIMLASPDERVQSIVRLLLINSNEVVAWPALVSAVFYANIYAHDTMMQMDAQFNTLFTNKVEYMKRYGLIVKQTATNLYVPFLLQDENMQLVTTHRYYIQISNSGSLIGEDVSNLSCYGRNILCKPGFAYAKNFVQSYLQELYTDDVIRPALPSTKDIRTELNAKTISWKDFVMQKKFTQKSTYDSNLYYRLRELYGRDIDVDVSVNYVRTKNGYVLVSDYQPEKQELDIKFYRKKLYDINKRFLKLKDNRFIASSEKYWNMLNVPLVSTRSLQQTSSLSVADLLADR